ncbi:MAG: aldehyde dehydrogenase family protein, partial [Bacteroidetes bacterium]|nr:aldehyde dehydrogenase family protein [Bacteroidota bacterium]
LKKAIRQYESELTKALHEDFKKSAYESYGTEIGLVLAEIDFVKKRLKQWMKPQKQRDVLINFPSKNFSIASPYGVALIIGPWNYPVQLCLNPLIGAIAAGNTALLKPSEWAPEVAEVLTKMIQEYFPEQYIAVIMGDSDISSQLVELDVDYIFFTGSTAVGKIIAESAGRRLIPSTLELGGKSPCIVDSSANLEVSARRIVWGKYLNAGQTCVAPDYVLVEEKVKEPLLDAMKKSIVEFYGTDSAKSDDYPRIISDKHFERLSSLLSSEELDIIIGGECDRDERFISPTVVCTQDLDQPLIQEEIFGPILPVISYQTESELDQIIAKNAQPLACYVFTTNPQMEQKFIHEMSFGGGAINDTVAHLGNPHMAFGGIGSSGIGSYHGKHSFDAFSHTKSIMKKSFSLDLPMRYPPYEGKLKW